MADTHSVAEKMRLSEPTTEIEMKIDPHYRQQKCRPMTSFWCIKVYADIHGGALGRGRQTTVGLSKTAIFSVFAGCFFGNFRDDSSVTTRTLCVLYMIL